MPTNERTSGFRGLRKIAGEFAPGIQDKAVYGEPLSTIPHQGVAKSGRRLHTQKRPARTPGVFRSQPLNPAGGRFYIPLESAPAGVDFQRNST